MSNKQLCQFSAIISVYLNRITETANLFGTFCGLSYDNDFRKAELVYFAKKTRIFLTKKEWIVNITVWRGLFRSSLEGSLPNLLEVKKVFKAV